MPVSLRDQVTEARTRWKLLTLYQKFEHAVIIILTGLISLVVALAVWNLVLKILVSITSSGFDPTDYAVFQALFGMIFTVIIALEFKRSLLVVAERRHGIVQVRTVILLACSLSYASSSSLISPPPRRRSCLPSRRRFCPSAPSIGSCATRTDASAPELDDCGCCHEDIDCQPSYGE